MVLFGNIFILQADSRKKKKKEKGREFVVMDTTYNPPRILILLIQM